MVGLRGNLPDMARGTYGIGCGGGVWAWRL